VGVVIRHKFEHWFNSESLKRAFAFDLAEKLVVE
jgi:hypothetical protein